MLPTYFLRRPSRAFEIYLFTLKLLDAFKTHLLSIYYILEITLEAFKSDSAQISRQAHS